MPQKREDVLELEHSRRCDNRDKSATPPTVPSHILAADKNLDGSVGAFSDFPQIIFLHRIAPLDEFVSTGLALRRRVGHGA